MYQEFINQVIKTNQELKKYIDTNLTTEDLEYCGSKGHGGDHSLNIDIKAEKFFIDTLLPFGDIYSEEIGLVKSDVLDKIDDAQIVIDPIDGSDNFVSGLKYYGTSVALNIAGSTKVGIVFNLVDGSYILKDENGKVTKSFDRKSKPKIGIFERAYKYPEICKKLCEENMKYRSPGAVAVSLANAEDFNFVLFGGAMRSFDLDAALYINNHLHIYKNQHILIVAKNIHIFNKVKEIIKE